MFSKITYNDLSDSLCGIGEYSYKKTPCNETVDEFYDKHSKLYLLSEKELDGYQGNYDEDFDSYEYKFTVI